MFGMASSKPSPALISIAVVQLGGLIKKLKEGNEAPKYLVDAAEGLLKALERYQTEMKEKK